MERPATSASEKASPLLASSFVLFQGERRLSPFSLSLHLLFCLTHLFFWSLLPSLYFSMTSEILSCSLLSFPPLLYFFHLCIFLSPLHHSILSPPLTPALSCLFVFLSFSIPLLFFTNPLSHSTRFSEFCAHLFAYRDMVKKTQIKSCQKSKASAP